jgi:hypothetical protein
MALLAMDTVQYGMQMIDTVPEHFQMHDLNVRLFINLAFTTL